jgi:hypothetical protein
MRKYFITMNQVKQKSNQLCLGHVHPYDGKCESLDDDSDDKSPKRTLDSNSQETSFPTHKKGIRGDSVKRVPTLDEIHTEYSRIIDEYSINRPVCHPGIEDVEEIDIYQLFQLGKLKVPFDNTMTVQDLISIATPSPYGNLKSGLTELDTSVRFAYEISKDDIELNPETMKSIIGPDVLKQISEELYGGVSIGVELQKMNIYTIGGFFKRHQDTPKDIGTIGSLVIQIPFFKYTGGALNVYDDWHNNVGRLDRTKYLEMMAFYPEQIHEVTEVTKGGARITLSFTIIATPNGESNDINTVHDEIVTNIDTFCKELVFPYMEQTGRSLGFIFTHRYSIMDIVSSRIVKGIDRRLIRILEWYANEKHYVVTKLPIIVHDTQEEDDPNHQMVLTNSELLCGLDVPEDLYIGDIEKISRPSIVFFGDTDDMQTISKDEGHGEHTGNETNPKHVNNFYYSCASIIHRPIDDKKKQ